MEIRKPELIENEIIKLQKELKKSQKYYKIKPKKYDESLRIPNELKRYFPNKNYFDNHMQKLVWEEDD